MGCLGRSMAALGMCANERLICLQTSRGAQEHRRPIAVLARAGDLTGHPDEVNIDERRDLRNTASQGYNIVISIVAYFDDTQV